ncbi:MAG: hypothetical protein KAJ03_08415 [Gammaproteobacteria bacterium]|nr:hypothetical protein [Gammaproteobacteria bacterium]
MSELDKLIHIHHDSVIEGKRDDQTWEDYSEEMETIERAMREEGDEF